MQKYDNMQKHRKKYMNAVSWNIARAFHAVRQFQSSGKCRKDQRRFAFILEGNEHRAWYTFVWES